MATKTKRKTKKQTQNLIKTVLSVILIILAFFIYKYTQGADEVYDLPDGTAEFHFIDIGQGDATLILADDKTVLIDTGDRAEEDRAKLVKYLKDKNITTIDYFVATHPDADHIGSAAYVVENYDIKNVILSPKTHTSKTYENFITALDERPQINVINAQEMLGKDVVDEMEKNMPEEEKSDLELKILGPIGEYNKDDNNNPSVVIMARWGNTKVLLTGDAEKEAEERLRMEYYDKLDCDILKVGHHGSSSSSTNAFIKYVKPEYAVISCGVNNDYNHPHKEALDVLEFYKAKIYRTDLQGSIVAATDGETITFKTEK